MFLNFIDTFFFSTEISNLLIFFALETISDKYFMVHFNVEFNSKNSIDSCFSVHSKSNSEELKIDNQC